MFFQKILRFHINIIQCIPIIYSIIASISNLLTRTLLPNIQTTSSSHYAYLPGIYHIYPNSALTQVQSITSDRPKIQPSNILH
jgi:hypothetical protein